MFHLAYMTWNNCHNVLHQIRSYLKIGGKSNSLKVSDDTIFRSFCFLLRFLWEMIAANDHGVVNLKSLLIDHYIMTQSR